MALNRHRTKVAEIKRGDGISPQPLGQHYDHRIDQPKTKRAVSATDPTSRLQIVFGAPFQGERTAGEIRQQGILCAGA